MGIIDALKPGEPFAEPPLPRVLTRAQRAFAAAAVIAAEATRGRPVLDRAAIVRRGEIIRNAMIRYWEEGKVERLEKQAADIRERRIKK